MRKKEIPYSPEQFQALQKEMEPYRKVLSEASQTIRDKEVSEYPIMVVHQQDIELGIPLIDREQVRGNWSVNASTLEEFISRQLVAEDKAEEFRQLLQKHRQDLCIFVVAEFGANFVFLPG